MSEERLERIETELGRLWTGQDDLRRQMVVLHEDVIASIKTIPDSIQTCQRITDGKIAGLREEMGQRLDPLETAVRKHFGT